MTSDSTGSNWHKWDLHIHTPDTQFNNKGFNITGKSKEEIWKIYCQKLNDSGIDVFGITDYFSINNFEYLKNNRNNLGLRKDIVLLPNIELRVQDLTAKGSGKGEKENFANIHIIFSEDTEVQKIENFLEHIHLKIGSSNTSQTCAKFHTLSKSERDNINEYPYKDSILNALKDTGFNSSNYLIMDAAGNDGIYINPMKSGHYTEVKFFLDYVDIKQIQGTPEKPNQRDIEFYTKELPRDAKKDYKKNVDSYPCIIASDSHNLEDIGKKYTWIKAIPSFEGLRQIIFEPIDRISFEKPNNLNNSMIISHIKYGNEVVKFNRSLNTIIGGRSTGKSTLINTVLSCCNNIIESSIEKFDNSNYNQLYNLRQTTDPETSVEICWADGEKCADRKILFIPQDFMINIANNQDIAFNILIDNILRKNKDDDFYNIVKEKKDEIEEEKGFLKHYIENIKELETSKNKIPEPDEDIKGLKNDLKNVEKEISNISIKNIDDVIDEYNRTEKEIAMRKGDVKLSEKIANEVLHFNFNDECDKFLSFIESLPDKLEYMEEYKKSIRKLIKSFYKEIDNKNKKLIKNLTEYGKREDIKIQDLEAADNYKQLKSKISENNRLTQLLQYKKELQQNINKIEQLNNDEEKINNKLKQYYEKFLNEFIDLINNNVNLSKTIFSNKENDFKIVYKIKSADIYENVEYIKKNNSNSLLCRNFTNEVDEGNLQKLTLRKLIDELTFNKSKKPMDFLEDLANGNWVDIKFDLVYQDDTFQNMSQGKKSFAILKLLLEFSDSRIPIIIDQPEDSLDNRSIYEDLISYLREKKKERQIIVVTHNANIVVAADSENIIVANQNSKLTPNKGNVKFEYLTGAIEDNHKLPDSQYLLERYTIKEHIYDILEGGKEAFYRREHRYGL